MTLKIVVLPAPFGPTRQVMRPCVDGEAAVLQGAATRRSGFPARRPPDRRSQPFPRQALRAEQHEQRSAARRRSVAASPRRSSSGCPAGTATCGSASSRNGPTIEPASVRAPPTTTMVSSRIEASRSNDDGSMKLRNVAYSPPATPANAPGQRGGRDFGAQHVLAGGGDREFVLADRAQQAAERRAHDQPERQAAKHQRRAVHSSINWTGAFQLVAEQVGRRDAGQAVGAAGAGGPVGEHRRRQQLDAERGDNEIIAGDAQRRQRHQDVQQRRSTPRRSPAPAGTTAARSPAGNARRYRRRRRTPPPATRRKCRRCRPADWWTGRAARRSRRA